MSLLLKRKQSLGNDALLDLADFVVPKLVANMRAVDGGGDAKRVVTALTAERARKLAADARALMEMCELHASSVSTASMDTLVDDTMRCILAFADHKALLAFRRTSRRHRSLVDSLSSMCVARMTTRPPPLRKITAHPSLGCVLGNKLSVRIHAGVITDEHREAMRRMPVLRHVLLNRCSLLPYHFTEKRNALRAKFDASWPAVALATTQHQLDFVQSMTPDKLDDIELVLGRRVESILFSRPRILGLLDTPRKFKRLAVSTEALGSTSLFRMCTVVTEQLIVRVDDAHHQHVIRLLTAGAPPAPMAVADSVAAAVLRAASSGPALMLEVPNHRAIEWSRDALMTAASSFSHIYVSRFFAFDVFSGVSDTLQPLLDEHPELNEFVSVASDPRWTANPKFAAFWRAFTAV